jgi:transglutaminase-like putative cysteine protease
MILLAVAVYSVVYSVTAAITISHTSVLWITTALGLVCGLVISKSRHLPQAVLHITSCILGYWIALFLTSLAYHISLLQMLGSLHAVLTNGLSLVGSAGSDMVFLFYLAFLCFFLGYFGSWLIYRAHLPWLVALVYVSIMIVNLNYIAKRDLTFLMVLLVAALLPLIARVQLAGQLAQWRNEGLYTDQVWLRNLTSRFLRIVALFALLILPLSWLLPGISQPTAGVTMWDKLDNAWANLAHGNVSFTNPNSLFSPYQPAVNFFGDQLAITGSVNLPNGPVLTYTSSSPATGQYLEGYSFDAFDGHKWTSQVQSYPQPYSANSPLPQSGLPLSNESRLSTSITMLQPPGGTKHFIFAPAQPYRFSTAVTLFTNPSGNIISAWTQTDPLQENERYEVVSNLSIASSTELARIALPSNDPDTWRSDPSYDEVQQYYLQLPNDLSPTVLATAKSWTRGLHTAYGVASALQSHLSNQTNFTYSINNPPVPSNIDAVTWLLQTHRGYCTYYATAMVVMARLLHIPARIVNGFSQGHYNPQQKDWTVDGSDAHSWVQVYFPDLGWMNFDPTPGYSINNAGTPVTSTPDATKTPAVKNPTSTPQTRITPVTQPTPAKQQTNPLPGATNTIDGSSGLNFFLAFSLLILLGSCAILGLAIRHYRRSERGQHTTIASIYVRLCRVAGLVGSPPASWQTPYEYTSTLSKRFPQASMTLHRLADLFVRERWASPQQAPNMREQQELERLWPALRNMLLRSPFSRGR